MKASVLGNVYVADDVVTVEVFHTDYASYSRSVVPLAKRSFRNTRMPWRIINWSGKYGHDTDLTREPYTCTSTFTFTKAD